MQEGEVSLQDCFNVIKKRKKFIALVVGVSVIASAIIIFFSEPTYEVSTTLKIGKVDTLKIEWINPPKIEWISPPEIEWINPLKIEWKNPPKIERIEKQLIMSLPETKEFLTSNRLLDKTIKNLDLNVSIRELRERIRIKEVSSCPDLLKIIIRGESPQNLMKLAEALPNLLLEEHQKILDKEVIIFREKRLRLLGKLAKQRLREQEVEGEERKEQIALLENFIKEIEKEIKAVKKKFLRNPSEGQVDYLIEIRKELFKYQKEYIRLSTLEKNREGMEVKVPTEVPAYEISLEPTTIYDPAIRPQQPIEKPRTPLDLLLAGVAGLIGGIFLAFTGECLREKLPG